MTCFVAPQKTPWGFSSYFPAWLPKLEWARGKASSARKSEPSAALSESRSLGPSNMQSSFGANPFHGQGEVQQPMGTRPGRRLTSFLGHAVSMHRPMGLRRSLGWALRRGSLAPSPLRLASTGVCAHISCMCTSHVCSRCILYQGGSRASWRLRLAATGLYQTPCAPPRTGNQAPSAPLAPPPCRPLSFTLPDGRVLCWHHSGRSDSFQTSMRGERTRRQRDVECVRVQTDQSILTAHMPQLRVTWTLRSVPMARAEQGLRWN